MKSIYSIFSLLSSFGRLSPLQQFWWSIIIPSLGIIVFHWTPGSVLFYFVIELLNYWLCNLILLLFYAKANSNRERFLESLKFSLWYCVCLIGFYYYITAMGNSTNQSMEINVAFGQIIVVTIIYWAQFVYFVFSTKPKNNISIDKIIKEVSYRLTGVYFTLFCVIGYIFVFWTKTEIMNYALAFVLIFAKSLTDLVLVAVKLSNERNLKLKK